MHVSFIKSKHTAQATPTRTRRFWDTPELNCYTKDIRKRRKQKQPWRLLCKPPPYRLPPSPRRRASEKAEDWRSSIAAKLRLRTTRSAAANADALTLGIVGRGQAPDSSSPRSHTSSPTRRATGSAHLAPLQPNPERAATENRRRNASQRRRPKQRTPAKLLYKSTRQRSSGGGSAATMATMPEEQNSSVRSPTPPRRPQQEALTSPSRRAAGIYSSVGLTTAANVAGGEEATGKKPEQTTPQSPPTLRRERRRPEKTTSYAKN